MCEFCYFYLTDSHSCKICYCNLLHQRRAVANVKRTCGSTFLPKMSCHCIVTVYMYVWKVKVKVFFILVSPLLKGPAFSDLWDTSCLHTMYLPTSTTMPGARRIEIGNHSFQLPRGSRSGHFGTTPTRNIHPSINAPRGARTFDLTIRRWTP
jgi:hypothetical protein